MIPWTMEEKLKALGCDTTKIKEKNYQKTYIETVKRKKTFAKAAAVANQVNNSRDKNAALFEIAKVQTLINPQETLATALATATAIQI